MKMFLGISLMALILSVVTVANDLPSIGEPQPSPMSDTPAVNKSDVRKILKKRGAKPPVARKTMPVPEKSPVPSPTSTKTELQPVPPSN